MIPATTIAVASVRLGELLDRGLEAVLAGHRDLDLVASRLDVGQLEAVIALRAADVVLLSEALAIKPLVLKRLREAQPRVALVALVHGLTERYGRQLLAQGATSCLAIDASAEDLLAAIRLAAESKGMLVPATGRHAVSAAKPATLTARQWEVFELVRRGLSNPQIAGELHISVETVRTHLQRIYRCFGVTNRRELVEMRAAQSYC